MTNIRYIHPANGKSVVINKTTNEVVHLGNAGYKYGPESGILSGAITKTAPVQEIHIYLMDEGVEVWCPTMAIAFGSRTDNFV